MQIPTEINCQACQYLTSHPVDACPVCGTHFYWLVIPSETPGKAATEDFLVKMEQLVEGHITRDFLTHGGRLWLPHTFWDSSPNGDAIRDFSWITEIRCLQHGSAEKPKKWSSQTAEKSKEKGSPWDTKPTLPSDLLKRVRQEAEAAAARADGRETPHRKEAAPKPPPLPHPRIEPKGKIREGVFPREFLAPLMMLVFFLLLSLSFLVLRYHKNQMALSRPLWKDVTHERSVLP